MGVQAQAFECHVGQQPATARIKRRVIELAVAPLGRTGSICAKTGMWNLQARLFVGSVAIRQAEHQCEDQHQTHWECHEHRILSAGGNVKPRKLEAGSSQPSAGALLTARPIGSCLKMKTEHLD